MYFLSEWLMELKASDIRIHLYKLPIRNYEEMDYENSRLSQTVAQLNGVRVVAFYGPYIGSFKELSKWPDGYDLVHEYRSIDLDRKKERQLLGRLLMNGIGEVNKDQFYVDRGMFVDKKSESIDGIRFHNGIHMDVRVQPNGNIVFGFEHKSKLYYEKNLFQVMQTEKVEPGSGVFDPHTGTHYEFVQKLDQTVSDPYEPGEYSPINHYRIVKKRPDLVQDIDPQTFAVKVKKKIRNARPYTYIPQLLKLECIYSKVPRRIKQMTKLTPHEKTNKSIRASSYLLRKFNDTFFPYDLGLKLYNTQAEKLGYQVKTMEEPLLKVGEGVTVQEHRRIKQALDQGQVYEKPNRPLRYQYLIDHDVYQHGTPKMNDFAMELEGKSRSWGVPLERVNILNKLSFSNPSQLRLMLKKISWDPSVVTAVIYHEKNESIYPMIKSELGKNQGMMTQFIQLETIDNTFSIPQILLGIYTKAGIQPWVLDKPLHADCFIGYDVSYDRGKHASGIVQVFGYDGRPLMMKPLTSSEAGEKVDPETMHSMVIEVMASFQKAYNRELRHPVFHRDGKGYEEEIAAITDVLEESGQEIVFDYVSVIKNANRRMAYQEFQANGEFVNIPGTAYIDGKIAYLCSTNPPARVGMAKPIKIQHHTGPSSIHELVEDIYHLTFMNVHTDRKVRLPSTTNYADKNSTFFNRGMMPENPVLKGLASV